MPTWFYTFDFIATAKEKKARKRKHDEIVRAWKAGKLTWNEYIRQEKKYRT